MILMLSLMINKIVCIGYTCLMQGCQDKNGKNELSRYARERLESFNAEEIGID